MKKKKKTALYHRIEMCHRMCHCNASFIIRFGCLCSFWNVPCIQQQRRPEIEPWCVFYRSVPHQHVLQCLKSWVHRRPPPPPLPPLQPRTAPSTVVFPAAQAAARHSVRGTRGSHPPRKNQREQPMARISEGRNNGCVLSFMNSLSSCYTGSQSTVSIEPGGLKITGLVSRAFITFKVKFIWWSNWMLSMYVVYTVFDILLCVLFNLSFFLV